MLEIAASGQGQAVFLINLLQDVNILRPLIYLAAKDLRLETHVLATGAFQKRDASGVWQRELSEIVEATGTSLAFFKDALEAISFLGDKRGILIAGSESSLDAHKEVHEVFRLAPASLLKVTLQHGLECVGFLQSREQNIAHGKGITFGADVICGWAEPERLTSIAPSQRGKLYVAGPTAVMQPSDATTAAEPLGMGLVCENMHSARLRVTGDFKADFLSVFGAFCAALDSEGKQVTLRPHPGGQYTLKNNVSLQPNVTINNNPIYKVELSRYAYGISAPSSILVDMVLAGIPTAVWQDADSILDLGNYEGLTRISTLEDWIEFSRLAAAHPEKFVEQQQRFLDRQQMRVQPHEVRERYAALLRGATAACDESAGTHANAERVLFVSNSTIPTLQLSFIKPLAPLVASGEVVTEFIAEEEMKLQFGKKFRNEDVRDWVRERFSTFAPTIVVFCRYSAPQAELMLECARAMNVPTIYHIDDDLLHIPKEIGLEKHRFHNLPERLAAVRHLLNGVRLVYSSTDKLKVRLAELEVKAPVAVGDIYCSGKIISPARHRVVKKVGYMGIGHESDLASMLPALVRFMRRNEGITFELFGSIPVPAELKEFGDRIIQAPKIENYEEFLQRFSEYGWDIGICPLTSIHFNLLKANTKWVEYTSVGAAVVASRGTVYDECCADECGILAESEDEWLAALEKLTRDPEARFNQVLRAQAKLINEYSVEKLRQQVLGMFELVKQPKELTTASVPKKVLLHDRPSSKQERILYIANGLVPTLQLSFIKPLAPMVDSGEVVTELISVDQIKQQVWKQQGYSSVREWIQARFVAFKPSLVVFCRYNGPHPDLMLEYARTHGAPCIYHIDDDLLHVPPDIGEKHLIHNKPERLATVSLLLDKVDLVYCSTQKLKARLEKLGAKAPLTIGNIYCSGKTISEATHRPIRKVGYMASADHVHNLHMVMPAILSFMRQNPEIRFEFFGSIPIPEEFKEFGERVTQAPKIDNYEEFLQRFSEYEWDIGICPLVPIDFNMMKANTKWVEYTSVGAAVIAQKGTVYDDCCADGCGTLAETEKDWLAALESLSRDPELRFQQVKRAQEKLASQYSVERLRSQVTDVFSAAKANFLRSNPEFLRSNVGEFA